MRRKRMSVWCLIAIGLAACQAALPSAVPAQPAATSAPLAPTPAAAVPTSIAATSAPSAAAPWSSATETAASSKNLVVFSGETEAASDTFSLSAAADLKVSWQYQGRGHFAIWLVNVSEEVDDPAYDRLLVVDVPGENAGQAVQHLIAGDYHVEVEEADGPWTITVSAQP